MNASRLCLVLRGASVAVASVALTCAGAVSLANAQTTPQAQSKNDETAQLRRRVEQLEEQLIDIQVVLGTLETLAKTRGAASGPSVAAGGGGFAPQSGADGRLSALETQLRALASQVQQLSASQQPVGTVDNRQAPAANGGQSQSFGSAAPTLGFGSTTVQPEAQSRTALQTGRLAPPAPRSSENAERALPSSPAGGDAQGEYEAAYGLLLQQDYGAAQASFADFLKKHPRNPLAGNAQYWLGETYYVRGNYKSAAGAFLKGYRQFSRSNKAPDSLLKLAMSLDKLGQRAAACSSLTELGQKYPQAAAHVRRRASQERNRLRC